MSDEARKGRGRRWPESANLAVTSGIFKPDEARSHETIYAQLRRAILYGQIQPGAWLRQTELAEQFGVSRTPIREAMRSLEQEGLVEMVPNHGARATQLSLEAFEELYALRIGLEGLAARLAARLATDAQIADLRGEYDALEQCVTTDSLPEYLKKEWLFRVRCYEITGRGRLVAQVKYLREHAERYLRLAYTVEGRTHESLRYHKELVQAIADGDESHAEQTNQDALRWTLEKAGPIIAQIIDSES